MMPKMILVVDDNSSVREIIAAMLACIFQKAEIFQAEDGIYGLEVLPLRNFDLVITDFEMPRINGLELTKKIRDQYPDMKIIFSSGFDDQELAENALQAGADIFLQKPISLDTLKEVIPRL